MREIRFRVWDKYINKMITFENAEEVELLVREMGRFPGWTYDQVDEGFHLSSLFIINALMWALDGKTTPIMQFTGIKDKNDVEIYENDIVKYGLQIPGKGVVFFRNGCYFIQSIEEEWCPSLVSESVCGKLEVIGNTFENHEIIKRLYR